MWCDNYAVDGPNFLNINKLVEILILVSWNHSLSLDWQAMYINLGETHDYVTSKQLQKEEKYTNPSIHFSSTCPSAKWG